MKVFRRERKAWRWLWGALMLWTGGIYAQAPDGYYDDAEGKTGYELKTALKEIITEGHTDQGYDSLYDLYRQSDSDNYYENDGTVLDMYSENPTDDDPYEYVHGDDECGNYDGEGDCYNREHIMPQSAFDRETPMKDDGHFVVPADGYVNNRRSNYPFGIVEDPEWTSLNGSKVGPNSTAGYSETVFEPIDEFKGDIARMLFYVATRYEDEIDEWDNDMLNGTNDQVFADWFLEILLQWHEDDPVSQREIDRNEAVYDYQGNRNPFIDHPEWVNEIWGESSGDDTADEDDTQTSGSEIIAIQDFDGTAPEWSFTTDVAFFANGDDGFFGIHNANDDETDGTPEDTGVANPQNIDFDGITGDFLYVMDLNDEGNGTDGEATITFETVDISHYENVVLSFAYDIVGFDSGDYIKYELIFDGESQGQVTLPTDGEGWVNEQIPDNVSEIALKIILSQNGTADEAALDNFQLTGDLISFVIDNIQRTPYGVSPEDNVTVSADVFAAAGVAGVELHWGTDPADLSQTISMSLLSDDTYQTDSPIPAQDLGTIVYYEIYVLDNDANEATSEIRQYVVNGTCASDLFFSEYVEGSSNNKFLEIFNGTGHQVDLSGYEVRQYNNGSDTPTYTLSLSGILEPGEVFVIENDDETLGVDADLSTSSSVMNFNGDDALELYNVAEDRPADIIGKIGEDPGSEWGSGLTSTQDNTLRRKADVTAGDINGSDDFDPADQWLGYEQDDVSGLGVHLMDCNECSEPETDATFTDDSPTAVTGTTATLAWNPGGGDYRIVVMRAGAPVSFAPTDQVTYPADAQFGNGQDVSGNGEYVVYNGDGSSVEVTNLTPGTEYYAVIYEYNCEAGSENYLVSDNPPTDAFLTYPDRVATFDEVCVTNGSIDLAWTPPASGLYDGFLLVAREGATPHSVNALDPTTDLGANLDYTQAAVFGSTDPQSRILYNGTETEVTVTGLTSGVSYTFAIYAYATGTSGYLYSAARTTTQEIRLPDVEDAWAFESDSEATVLWTVPDESCFDEVLVVANETAGIDFTPSGDGSDYTADATYAGPNSIVYKGTGREVTVTGLTNGTTYYFEIFVRKGTDWSEGLEVSATPVRGTVLRQGDLAILAVNTDIDNQPGSTDDGSGDQIAFVLFKDIEPGTKLFFTDNGYQRLYPDKWGNTEGVLAITRINTTLPAGTIVVIEANDQTNGNILSAEQFDVYTCGQVDNDWGKQYVAGSGGFNLADDDDIWIMQGGTWDNGTDSDQNAVYTGNVLFGWTESGWDDGVGDGSGGTTWSALYPGSKCFTTVAPQSEGKVKFDDPVDPDFSATDRDPLDWMMIVNDPAHWITFSTNDEYNSSGFDYKNNTDCPQLTIADATHISGRWTGARDNQWFDCSNWDDLRLPDENVDVTIDVSSDVSVVIDTTHPDAKYYDYTARARHLLIDADQTLKVAKPGSLLEVYGDLTIAGGAVLDMNNEEDPGAEGARLVLYGQWNNLNGASGFDQGKSQVVLAGDSLQTVSNNEGDEIFYDLIIDNPAGVQFASGNTVAENDLQILRSTPVVVADGHYLLVGRHLTNNAVLVVENTGSLVQTDDAGTIDGTGAFVLNKLSRPLAHYWDYVFWSSPLRSTGLTLGSVVPGAWRYYAFDPSLQDPDRNPNPAWIAKQSDDVFPTGLGMAISAPEDFAGGTLQVSFAHGSDPFNNGEIDVDIVVNGTGGEDGDDWNLIGNPYPSAIDFDSLAQDNTVIRGSYYAWTNCAGLDSLGHHQSAGYAVYATGSGGTAACNGTGSVTPGPYIPSAQAVMVEGLENGTLTFRNAYRVTGHNDTVVNRLRPHDRVWLDLTSDNEGIFSQILVAFVPGATDGLDRLYDARSLGQGEAYLYTLLDQRPMTIQGLAPWDGQTRSLQAGVYSSADRQLKMVLSRREGVFEEDVPVYLYDNETGIWHRFKDGPYYFHVSDGDHPGRFTLVFGERPLEVDQAGEDRLQIRGSDGYYTVRSAETIRLIIVYDVQGRELARYEGSPVREVRMDLSAVAPQPLIWQIQTESGQYWIRKTLR